jgi:hypothetical protein
MSPTVTADVKAILCFGPGAAPDAESFDALGANVHIVGGERGHLEQVGAAPLLDRIRVDPCDAGG